MVGNRGNRCVSQVANSTRVSSRTITPMQYSDYLRCSFSESEPSRQIPIPPMKLNNRSSGGRGVRGNKGLTKPTSSGRGATAKQSADVTPVTYRNIVLNEQKQKMDSYFVVYF